MKQTDDKAKSKQYFNRHSSTGVNRNGYWNRDYKVTAKILTEAGVNRHIDIGCGNGAFLEYLHNIAPEIALHGLDYSAEMVKRSRERLPIAEITEGDAEDIPLPDNTFDGVSCHMSIHHYPHPDSALSEMYRILKPGGIVLINDLTGPAWLIRLMNRSFRYWNTGDHAVYTRETMETMLRDAGFREIRSRNLTPFSYVCCGLKERRSGIPEAER